MSKASIGSIGYAIAWNGCTLGRYCIWHNFEIEFLLKHIILCFHRLDNKQLKAKYSQIAYFDLLLDDMLYFHKFVIPVLPIADTLVHIFLIIRILSKGKQKIEKMTTNLEENQQKSYFPNAIIHESHH